MKKISNSIIFSIVVCTYNREKFIEKCLDSLVHLDFPKNKFEIIVVDDSSKDNTVNLIKKYPVKLIQHKKNKGIAGARNTGLEHASGKIYICFDDDCYVSKDWLKNLDKAYKNQEIEEVSGIAGIIELPNKSGLIEKYMSETEYGNPSPLEYVNNSNIFSRFSSYLNNMFSPSIKVKENVFEVGEIWGANCSFPVAILKSVSGWNENLSGVEDTDLCDRIKKKFPNKKFFCTKNAILYHDHQLSLKGFLLKPYVRGNAVLRFYLKNKKIPPIFPFPLAIILLTLAYFIFSPISALVLFLLLPQAFYSWWGIKAFKDKKLYFLIFAHMQFAYELFATLGLFKISVKKFVISIQRVLLILFLLFGVLTNILIVDNIHFYYLREALSTAYLLIIPGLIISWAIKNSYKNVWEFISYTVGLSIAALMLLGLGISYILPQLHIPKPLLLQPILISLDIFLGMLWTYSFIRNNPVPIQTRQLGLSIKSILLGITATIFPILSIIGAFSLNNNQSNIFTMAVLISIAAFVVIVTILRNKVSEHLFPYSLFMIALSLLFMTSLRGWYITGHDIFLEYFIFQVTKAQGIWRMVNFQDPYNACLSITILPTIISRITHINDLYIYKALYQIIFSLSIIATYLFVRKLLSPFLSFLSAFIIVSLPTFMTDMPMLNRQEVALLFFALLLNVLFHKAFSTINKKILFMLFGVGLLLSHYSTTYIAVGLFVGAFLIHFSLRVIGIHSGIKSIIRRVDRKLGLIDNKPNLRFAMIAILLAVSIIWNVNITNTASGITTTINNVVKDLQTLHFAKAKSDPGAYGLLGNKAPTQQLLLTTYINTATKFVRKFNDDSAFLNKTVYSQYNVSVGKEAKAPLTTIGRYIKTFHISAYSLNDELKQYYAKIIQIFIIVGFVAIFFFKKRINNFEKEYLILTITFFGILVLQTVLPGGSIDYGILRLFQQGMILFSVPLIMGGLALFSVFNFIHKNIKIYLLSFTFVFFFLYLSGVIPTLTGGYYPQLNLSNGGFYYDAYYTHTQDFVAMNWLEVNRNKKTPVQSDWFALKKIHTYESFYSIDGLIPSIIRVNSYVYLSVSNLQTGQVIIYTNGAPLYYKYDFGALDANKNLIYNNGGSKIYR